MLEEEFGVATSTPVNSAKPAKSGNTDIPIMKVVVIAGVALLILYVLNSLLNGPREVGSTKRDVFVWIDVVIAIFIGAFLIKSARKFARIV